MIADGFGLLFYGDGEGQIHESGILLQYPAMGGVLAGRYLVVVGGSGALVAQLVFVFQKKVVNILPYGGGYFFFKKCESSAAFFSDVVECGVVLLLRVDEGRVGEFKERLLEGEVVSVLFVQDKFGELGVA